MKAWFVIFTVSAVVSFIFSLIAAVTYHSIEWGLILAFCSGCDAMWAVAEYRAMRSRA